MRTDRVAMGKLLWVTTNVADGIRPRFF
jgi:hypothetical protein